jgi:hypothetical protein
MIMIARTDERDGPASVRRHRPRGFRSAPSVGPPPVFEELS